MLKKHFYGSHPVTIKTSMRGKKYRVITDVAIRLRDLQPGDLYVTLTSMQRAGGGVSESDVRQRTEDPFASKTMLGTEVESWPSSDCYLVLEVEDA